MDEFNLMTGRLLNLIAQGENGLTVIQAFPEEKKSTPLRGNLAVASLQKIEIGALGLGDWCGSGKVPAFSQAKRIEAEFRVILCSPKSGRDCWSLFERVAGRLSFSEELAVTGISCGEMRFQRDWGGMCLPLTVRCLFGMTDSKIPLYPKTDQLRIVAKAQ